MHLANWKATQTGKDLKCPAARLTGMVRQVLNRLLISLEKMGVSDAMESEHYYMQKPNRTLLKIRSLS
jgi:hypothetical protein